MSALTEETAKRLTNALEALVDALPLVETLAKRKAEVAEIKQDQARALEAIRKDFAKPKNKEALERVLSKLLSGQPKQERSRPRQISQPQNRNQE
ncbi:MAG: hypothetical protein A2600_13255 [Candidatus Lambdaproteobacteria bacterium RIFOXYD1_FULL_56_27]|uniref:Uncharacterized protein n=1 Tax=Candidatus Lambdaproteobacteria bacterium RIFOXYD2_FULL_56_26 TaxID=1817773 RepID=A0A1F6GLL5_9PROT|nr:MAG: hypothetical protein A2557_01290 [Candidatus Lambdaproteobacteria bacterium RIFOXYD2_FULL_56_26]OGH03427.1 MAG: hypothetical protein A2426_03060 [Candidatus Lambdaproteobacteria bacterium RIFOXYC1_FULL_56_13]OGH08908.1 MAG: hypothetical protein A2600_13255 [Candidatus Lambdaproteobacteria bacterium RIFOXYD1_FULL_56_27]